MPLNLIDIVFNSEVNRFYRYLISYRFEYSVVLVGITLASISPKFWVVDDGSDDLLYVQQALAIKSGHWLGTFADGGGLKLPGFQIFLAFFSFSKLPPYIGVICLQIIGAVLIRKYFKATRSPKYIYQIIFLFCVINPALYGANNARLVRDGFYSSLLTILFGLSLNLYLQIREQKNCFAKSSLRFFALYTLVSAWIAFTREETMAFLLFDASLLLIIYLMGNWTMKSLKDSLVLTLVLFLILGFCSFDLQKVNEHSYNTPSISTLQSGPLVTLENQWSRIQPTSKNPRITLSSDQRNIAYAAIPDFARQRVTLEKYLKWYSDASCGQARVCNDIGSGWTYWGLFYGLTTGEGLNNPKLFNDQVKRMTREIVDYCERNTKFCDRAIRIPTIGSPRNLIPIFRQIPVELTRSMLQRGDFDPVPISFGGAQNISKFKDLIPFGGPPAKWPPKPIGNPDASLIAILFCLFVMFRFIKPEDMQVEEQLRSTVNTSAPFAFLLLLVLFRGTVTSIVSVVGWDVNRSNYELPNNTLLWIFLGMLVTLPLGRRKHNSQTKDMGFKEGDTRGNRLKG